VSQLNKIAYLEDERIKIARGQVKGVIPVHKFGAVPSLSTNTTGTVWDKTNTIYPWSVWNAGANTITVSSSSASDVGKSVVVSGLDQNYDLYEEEIELDTQNGNASSNSFIRVFRAFMGNGDTNVGTISIQNGTTEVALIITGFSQTLMAIYTIPRNYNGYIFQGTCSAQAGADATGNMFVRYGGTTAFRVGHSFEVDGDGGQYLYPFTFPPELPEKSDIDVRLTTRSNNGRYTAAFDLLLVRNPNIPN
jgi:hypothetical protein